MAALPNSSAMGARTGYGPRLEPVRINLVSVVTALPPTIAPAHARPPNFGSAIHSDPSLHSHSPSPSQILAASPPEGPCGDPQNKRPISIALTGVRKM